MRGRDFLSLSDFEPDELRLILDSAERLKRAQRDREPHRLLSERSLAMVFERPSLRTRTTFTVGMTQLGGHAIDLMDEHMQIGVRESVPDIAQNLERWVDVVAARVHKHATAEQLAAHASVPVINALSDRYHPCQVLADLLTIREHLGGLEGRVLAFVGDGFNVCHSLMLGAGLAGMHVRVATPAGFEPMAAATARSLDLAKAAGGSVEVGRDPIAAVRGADVVYTDSWVSMGLEEEAAERSRVFPPLSGQWRADGRGGLARDLSALPARPPGRGGHRRGDGRPSFSRVRPGGKPAARAKGPVGVTAARRGGAERVAHAAANSAVNLT